jgi:hypothetical protein
MGKKHFTILYLFSILAVLLFGNLGAQANPFYHSHAETVRLPKAKKAVLSKEAIREAKQNMAGELQTDDLYGHPDEYFIRMQRGLQLTLAPPEAIYNSLTENLFDAPAEISDHSFSFSRQKADSIPPYYYTFLFRLTPF